MRSPVANPFVLAACEIDFSDEAELLRCGECDWSGPATRFAAGIHAHTSEKHKRKPTAIELVARNAAKRDKDNAPSPDVDGVERPKFQVALRRGGAFAGSALRDSL